MYFTTSLDSYWDSTMDTDMPYKLCRITGTRTNWEVFTGIHNQLERHSIGLLAQLRPECFEYRTLIFLNLVRKFTRASSSYVSVLGVETVCYLVLLDVDRLRMPPRTHIFDQCLC